MLGVVYTYICTVYIYISAASYLHVSDQMRELKEFSDEH